MAAAESTLFSGGVGSVSTAGVCDRERFPCETTGNDGYVNDGDGDEVAALLVRADCVDIIMDATVVWPHRVCTALCARTGWCRAADMRVHATTTTTTNDKNNGARCTVRNERTQLRTNKQTNEFDFDDGRRRW